MALHPGNIRGFQVYELKISVQKVMGECTACPPMKPGDYFIVSDGDIQIPDGGYICLWALQSLMPLITPKEREIAEREDEDWIWRVHHAQCPDPKGRVVFKIERIGKVSRSADPASEGETPIPAQAQDQQRLMCAWVEEIAHRSGIGRWPLHVADETRRSFFPV